MSPKSKPRENAIISAVRAWLRLPSVKQLGLSEPQRQELVEKAPGRWVVYEPMALLPTGSFALADAAAAASSRRAKNPWAELLPRLGTPEKDALWLSILRAISDADGRCQRRGVGPLTRLAVNGGIPPRLGGVNDNSSNGKTGKENILRSPTGLRMLYGDFGPPGAAASRDCAGDGHEFPAQADLDAALWVSTKQNGIHQVWAPRWTMYSRGNVKEKARLLRFHDMPHSPPPPRSAPSSPSSHSSTSIPWTAEADPAAADAKLTAQRRRAREELQGRWAVDLYAGIGYFVFSYVQMGLRVLCWELNPWSVEALGRGAGRNGWSVRVVKGDELRAPTAELVAGGEQIVVFQEDNQEAGRRMRELRDAALEGPRVLHVNCGLLPSSAATWGLARTIVRGGRGSGGVDGWLHLHENVGAADAEGRRRAIQQILDKEADDCGPATVEHVELVKTFAPGVWHCVFDVYMGVGR